MFLHYTMHRVLLQQLQSGLSRLNYWCTVHLGSFAFLIENLDRSRSIIVSLEVPHIHGVIHCVNSQEICS